MVDPLMKSGFLTGEQRGTAKLDLVEKAKAQSCPPAK